MEKLLLNLTGVLKLSWQSFWFPGKNFIGSSKRLKILKNWPTKHFVPSRILHGFMKSFVNPFIDISLISLDRSIISFSQGVI